MPGLLLLPPLACSIGWGKNAKSAPNCAVLDIWTWKFQPKSSAFALVEVESDLLLPSVCIIQMGTAAFWAHSTPVYLPPFKVSSAPIENWGSWKENESWRAWESVRRFFKR
ncbi:hypothetical protein EDD15DRAFT_2192602 [Pisolithus albus]|nr:hypothetical protein EDD15DRAFT_2192602 [Pisolithus albus]